MALAFGIIALLGASIAAIAHQLHLAPEGYEDETGFHQFSSGNAPMVRRTVFGAARNAGRPAARRIALPGTPRPQLR